MDLRTRLSRYFSPPLFPLHLRDLTSRLELHDAPDVPIRIGGFQVSSKTVIHPGPTVGYRIEEGGSSMAYIPDHEPALGASDFPDRPMWTSGHDLAADVDLLVHDAQYFPDERAERIGWGHTSTTEVARFAQQAGVRQLACFHHDPAHDDETVNRLVGEVAGAAPGIVVTGAREGATIEL
jgi:ribonuclease BN (tRNA processing enzyme)